MMSDISDILSDFLRGLTISNLSNKVAELQREQAANSQDADTTRQLAGELLELQLRHQLLICLLIHKGLISAEEYAQVISLARSQATDTSRSEPRAASAPSDSKPA